MKLEAFGFRELTDDLDLLCKEYETGLISSERFIKGLKSRFPDASEVDLINAWNSILLDFPEYRLVFLEKLCAEKSHRLFLLSNTNDIHIGHVITTMGRKRFQRFKNCFEEFYLSHEIKMRKPNREIFKFVLEKNSLKPEETLFIDDTVENTEGAQQMGIQCWNLKVGKEDIIELTQRLK